MKAFLYGKELPIDTLDSDDRYNPSIVFSYMEGKDIDFGPQMEDTTKWDRVKQIIMGYRPALPWLRESYWRRTLPMFRDAVSDLVIWLSTPRGEEVEHSAEKLSMLCALTEESHRGRLLKAVRAIDLLYREEQKRRHESRSKT
jgi:hypothetical protein